MIATAAPWSSPRRQDYREAAKWYRFAAEQGDALAQESLGVAYVNGQGVAQDYSEAVKWFRLGAEQGNAEAQNNLGAMYAKGRGVTQHYLRAYMWLNLAASSKLRLDEGQQVAKSRDIVAKRLTPTQVIQAQEMARQCAARNFKNCD